MPPDTERPAPRLAAGAAAFGACLAGILLVASERTRGAGAGLTIVGALLGAWALGARLRESRSADLQPGSASRTGDRGSESAAALADGGRRAMDVVPEPDRGRVRSVLAWSALAASALATLVANVLRFRAHDPLFGKLEALWLLAVALLAVGTWLLGGRARSGEPVTRGEAAVLALLVLGGTFARVLALRELPFAIHQDEILTGQVARLRFLPWNDRGIFTTLWEGIELPALWFAFVAGSLKAFGTTLEALRLPAALFGAATLVPFWALARELFGRRAALLATALLAASTANIHFARVTLNNVTAAFFWTLAFALLLRALRGGGAFAFAMAGLAGGVGEHFYYGTRLLPFVLAAFAVLVPLLDRSRLAVVLRGVPFVALGYVVGLGPLLAHFRRNPGLYLGRGRGVLAWDHVPTSLAEFAEMVRVLWPKVRLNLLGISTIPGDDSLYFAPLMGVLEAALLALGVAILLRRVREPGPLLLLLAAFGVAFAGGTLVPPQPAFNHWTPAFGAIWAILAAPLAAALALSARLGARGRAFATGALVLVVAAASALSLDFYFRRYYSVRPEYDIGAAISRYEASLGPGWRIRTLGESWQRHEPERTSYLAKGLDAAHLRDPGRDLPLWAMPEKGIAFLIFRDNTHWLPRLRELYPGGREVEVKNRDGWKFFVAYLVEPGHAPP